MARRVNTAEDVWKKIDVRGPDECWLWLFSVSTSGYGQFYFSGRLHTAHRVAYELVKGPIPDGLQLDHLCRNRRCCNPAHLDPVTCAENIYRSPIHKWAKTHCPQGHPYAGRNLIRNSVNGGRACRECNNRDSRERKRRARADGVGCPGPVADDIRG